ncbi:hypothetical protein BVG16_19880 [Paenibacillus selenitireducens]|uniref:DNA-binding response regulator n=1 Tax=Paenibacillus selenitireducens TaxID=1324314 RepID=A0A1T2X7P1_9BACL|nr:response regulator [Paenibacillus selenitireducens]OPA75603.1 hypothetical protein BVG16_19880 [Paenibacillus selenitireducens]
MRKLLIVDDEKNIRLGLKSMIDRQFSGQYVFYFASDGEEALNIVENEAIEMLITDIRMPVMDGISLINQLQDRENKPAIIILSGYDEFQYAKEAIRCEVKEYLLKPIVRDELFQVLNRLETELTQKKAIQEQLVRSQLMKEEYAEGQLNYVLMNDQVTSDEIRERLLKVGLDWMDQGFYVGLIKISENGQPDQRIHMGSKMDCLLRCACDAHCTRFDDKNGKVVMLSSQLEVLEHVTSQMSHDHFYTFRIGISERLERVEYIREGYAQAGKALNYFMVQHGSGAIHYHAVQMKNADYELPLDEVRKIANMLGTGRDAEMMRLLVYVLDMKRIAHYEIGYLEGISHALNELVFDKVCHVYGEESIEILRLYKLVGNIYNFDHYQDYYHNVKSLLQRLNDYVGQVRSVHNGRKEMQRALQYIQDHYDQDLNMAMVSNYVSLNYSYFSQAFKEYTGESFVGYLRKLRMAKGKELLETTDFKVYEVSAKVGFENVKHFTRVFREMEGISPLEYRTQRELLHRK